LASPPRFLGRSRAFARYLKTKNFHWHVSGPHFRDYHLLLDEHSEQIFASADVIAERVRKIGGTTLRSIGQISQLQSDASFVPAHNMLRELMNDNKAVAAAMRLPTSTATSRPRDSWRISSTRPSGAPGSCSRQAATRKNPGIE